MIDPISARSLVPPRLRLLGLVALGAAAICVAQSYVSRVDEERRVEEIAVRLDALYAADNFASDSNLKGQFSELVDLPSGRDALRRLDSADARIAYDEACNRVYFIHRRAETTQEQPRSCLGWAYELPESRHGTGHAGVPGFVELTSVEIEGDAARLRFRTSSDPLVGRQFGLVPGAMYEVLLEPPGERFDFFALLRRAIRA